jgi:phosphoribosyl 1,2-cyclic phosphate phosphodiesterase
VRPLSHDRPVPVYGNAPTISELKERFSYIFHPAQIGGGLPQIECHSVSGPVSAGGLRFTPVPVKHGNLDILGWAIAEDGTGPQAVYLTDTSAIPAAAFPLIKNPGVLIIGALRRRPHPTHFNFDQALEAALNMGARSIYLTHICHDYTHEEIISYCENFLKSRGADPAIRAGPAWDGLKLEI